METEKIAVYDDKHIGWKDDHKSLQQSNLISHRPATEGLINPGVGNRGPATTFYSALQTFSFFAYFF